MSLSIKELRKQEKKQELKQELLNIAENRNKVLIDSLAYKMNKAAGQMNDYLHYNSRSGTNGTTAKRFIASAGKTSGGAGTNNEETKLGNMTEDSLGEILNKIPHANTSATIHLYAAGKNVNVDMENILNGAGNIVLNYGYVQQGNLTGTMSQNVKKDVENEYNHSNDILFTYSNGAVPGNKVLKTIKDISSIEAVYAVAGSINEKSMEGVLRNGNEIHVQCSIKGLEENKGKWILPSDKTSKYEYANGADRDALNNTYAFIEKYGYKLKKENDKYDVEIPSLIRKSKTVNYEKSGKNTVHVEHYTSETLTGDLFIEKFDFCGHDDLGLNAALYLVTTQGTK